MDISAIATISATVIATIAGVATIIANIRYMKSENSKVLKSIEEGQERQTVTIIKGQEVVAKILERIEERIEQGQERQLETLEGITKGQEVVAKILERIEGNTRKT